MSKSYVKLSLPVATALPSSVAPLYRSTDTITPSSSAAKSFTCWILPRFTIRESTMVLTSVPDISLIVTFGPSPEVIVATTIEELFSLPTMSSTRASNSRRPTLVGV